MAQIQKGTTYSTGDQVTATNLNALADAAILLPGAITDQTAKTVPLAADTVLIHSAADTALRKSTLTQLFANATGIPISTGISGLGTGIATALAINTGTTGAPALLGAAGAFTTLTASGAINSTQDGYNTFGSAAGQGLIRIGSASPSGDNVGWLVFNTSNSVYNWRIAANTITSGALDISASTVAGGSTFTTSIAKFSSTGLAVTGALSATSNITSTATNPYFVGSSATAGTIYYGSTGAASSVQTLVNNTQITTVSSTGLAVTGGLSTTGSVTATAGFVIGNDNSFLYDSGTGAVTLRLGASGPYGSFLTNSGDFMVDGAGGTLLLGAAGTRVATITSTGLGIGTSSPSEKLSVLSADNVLATNIFAVRANNLSQGVGISFSGIRKLTSGTNSDLNFDGAGSGNIILNATGGSGNVGVGLTNPSYKLQVNGAVAGDGYQSHAGTGAAFGSNVFNFQWTGNPYLWVDTTNVGQIATVSDYRIKKNVTTQTASGLDRVMQLRPVSYEFTDYKELFKADGIVREGFIAHEVQEVIPSGAEGTKDEENRVQNLRVDAILSVTVKALQELNANLVAELQSVHQRLAALESK
jgi:hypothetical protein